MQFAPEDHHVFPLFFFFPLNFPWHEILTYANCPPPWWAIKNELPTVRNANKSHGNPDTSVGLIGFDRSFVPSLAGGFLRALGYSRELTESAMVKIRRQWSALISQHFSAAPDLFHVFCRFPPGDSSSSFFPSRARFVTDDETRCYCTRRLLARTLIIRADTRGYAPGRK